MNAFYLKIIALLTMIIDHIGAVFPQYFGTEFRVVGRVAFPIYVYLVAEGFRHTKNPIKFLIRLGLFAIISEPFFDMAIHGASFPWGIDFFNNTNIFYTLFLGGASIYCFEKIKEKIEAQLGANEVKIMAFTPLLFFMWVGQNLLDVDYGGYGVAFIFIMYVIKPLKFRLGAMALLCVYQQRWMITHMINYWFFDGTWPVPTVFLMMIPFTLLSVVFVAFYNGKRGPSLKWFFYASYPVHLFALWLISTII